MKFLKISLLAAAAAALSTASLQAATVTAAGTLENLTPVGNGVGTDAADLDAQGVGTDGFIAFASFAEGSNRGGLAWNEGIIDNSPAYITPMAAGTSVASGGWANYDDVTIGGTTYNTGGITFGSAAGTEAALFAFELSGTIPGSFTVGLLTDNSDNVEWAVTNARIEGPGAISADQDLVPDGGSDLLQFNISGAVAGDIFTVYGTSNGAGSLIGAATFDISIDITDPTDTDGDKIGDNWEKFYFGDLDVTDGTVDSESDGLTDLEEWQEGTNPLQADTDADGLTDGDEVNANNPDGVATNPLNSDTDGDELSDGDEVQGNNSQNFTSNPILGDTDSDQFDDAAEIAALTDPRDPDDFPLTPPLNLLAYFEFEDDYLDSSGGGATAVPTQNPTEVNFISGFRGQGADINDPDANPNSGGSINIPIDANPGALPEVSFGGWVNVEAFEFDGFMAIDNGGWDRGITVSNHTGATGFGIASGAGPVMAGTIASGSWQYVVGTFNMPAGRATLYVGDDVEGTQATETATTPDAGVSPGEIEIEIGRYDNQDLDGIVDDIFVFGSELSPHQANAIRNLRLSELDYSPLDAARVFELFESDSAGDVNGVTWSPLGGLATDNSGEVVNLGGLFTVVLDDAGNGMSSGHPVTFSITRVERTNDGLELDFNSRSGRLYAVDVSIDLQLWLEVDDGVLATGTSTTFTVTDQALLSQRILYCRVKEAP